LSRTNSRGACEAIDWEDMMSEEVDYTIGSDNVFADLGIPKPEEALAKAELARQIGLIIERRRLTQVEAARLLGIDQPKVSALRQGKLKGFSTERLLRFLTALNCDVEIVLTPRAASANARIHVTTH
ncbi:MAG TPA: helix-turn-helix transcriptional regulator, partial [Thermomicrobiales bacterium]|nr:helix-turn-helix transcriptional regulator [Thermomicrobiales bacterium]